MLFAQRHHLRRAQSVIVSGFVRLAVARQPVKAHGAHRAVLLLLLDAVGQLQLDKVDKRIRIARKHTGAGRTVHALFAALPAF